MIDLSHLTEEEQEMILIVLKRDEELKKAEEDRIRALQKKGSPAEDKLKYLTGEWFYEAKSQRHTDKIHGSEIILASMKQRKAGALDRSLSLPRTASDAGSDIVIPPKPPRCLETPEQLHETRESHSFPEADETRRNVMLCSPARPRHNPFNQASIVPEESENTEPISLYICHPAGPASPTSAGSVTSEGSSVGFRPVPKKRTFLSRKQSPVSDGEGPLSGRVPLAVFIVPVPRERHRHRSSGGLNPSSEGGITTASIAESQNNPPSQPTNTPNQEKPFTRLSTVEGSPDDLFKRTPARVPSLLNETEKVPVALNEPEVHTPLDLKWALFSDSDRHNERLISGGQRSGNRDGFIQREHDESSFTNRESSHGPFAEPLSPLLSKAPTASSPTGQQYTAFELTESQDDKKEVEEKTDTRNVGTAIRQEDLNQPVPYDLQISDDKQSNKQSQVKMSGWKAASKPSPRNATPTGEGGDSIVKVLEWFSRSTDSSDWLETESRQQGDADQEEEMAMEDVIEATRRDRGDVYENRYQLRERTAPWGKRDHPQEDVSSDEQDAGQRWKESTNVAEREEEVKIVTGVQVRPQEAKASEDDHQDDQRPTISHLKSFWERGNTGPKILISRSNTGVENGLRPVHQTTEKEKERAREQVEEERTPYTADTHSIAALERVDGRSGATFRVKEHDQIKLDEKNQAISGNDSTTRRGVGVPTTGIRTSPGPHRREDHKHTADYLTLAEDPQVLDRRDNEILSLTGLSLQPELNLQSSLTPETDKPSPSRLSPDSGAVSQSRTLDCDTQYTLVQSRASPQPDTFLQSRASSQPVKSPTRTITPQPELLSRSSPQPGMPHYARDSPECDKPEQQSRISPHMEYLTGGIDKEQFTPNAETRNSTCGNVKGEGEEKRSVQSSVPPKKQDDPTFKDRGNSPHTRRPPPPYQESAAEMKKIRQLKSFWEQEKNRPVCRTGKSKELGDARLTSAPSKLNKRFTKSEYDLRSIVNESDSDDDSNLSSDRKPFTIISMNQRLSPNLGNRSQFENLRDFWGDATSNHKGTTSSDEPKSPKKKESVDSQHSKLESKQRIDSVKGNKEREHRPRSPNDRPIGAGAGPVIDSKANLSHCIPVISEQQRGPRPALLKRGSVENPTTEEKPPRPQGTMGKDSRLPKTRKDSFGNSSGRASGMRHARSMFALNVTDQPEPDKASPGQRRKTHEASPVQGKKTALRRQSAERGPSSRTSSRSSEESESLAPRARAFVPRDYRHYLGITEKTGVHASLAPATKERDAEGKVGAELDLSGPVRTSTPTGSEERYGRRGGKTAQQHPLRSNLASAETSRESCPSSASDTRSNSRTSSNRENEEENPVRKALKRAETRSKNLAKSLEDITAFLPSRQDRRQDPVADLRPGSGASSQTGPSSSSFSDPERLKKLSKSVPSFLQKEGDGCETDSASEDDSYHGGRQMFDRSMTNLSTSSGMASTSSLMTMYSGDFGNIEVQGNIQFSINYVQKLREFHIFVAQCRDLAAVDPKRGRSDPYVKSYLMPDKAKLGKRKTSVKKKTLNPTFNEILRYRVRMEYLRTQTLFLSVWHHDTFGKNCFLGEVDMDLSKWDFDHAQMIYLALKARPSPQPADERGEMRLAIRFLPQIAHSQVKEGPNTGEVHIWVKECKNLPLVRGAVIDPYVKCFVLPDTSRKSRQKTRVLRRTANPTFNHTMVYDGFQREDLREACVELTVWDRDKLASSLLGGLRLGPGTGRSYGAVVDWMDSTSCEVALWERMMASPDEWVEDVLPLRMLTTAKTSVK